MNIDRAWEIYENMNEILVVSDLDTHEIVYLNKKAKKCFGIEDVSEINGRKCHELLQHSPYPCAICKIPCLESEYYDDWRFVNPVLGNPLLYKDTIVEDGGRRYRMELTIDMNINLYSQQENIKNHLNIEQIINEGLHFSLSAMSPDDSINILIEYIGKSLKCDRMYIFEEDKSCVVRCFSNTYEWCEEGIIPFKDNLQKIPDEDISTWLEQFNRNENIINMDTDELRYSDPKVYQYLKPLEIRSFVASPLVYAGDVIGFFGVDNPPKLYMTNISTLFMIMGHFIVSLLRRRDLFNRLEKLSFYDELTGAGNRHLMSDCMAELRTDESVGIVYCDVTGLKRVNDSQGHEAGDALLVRSCNCLKTVFPEYKLFRLGGDEFLVLCSGISEDELDERVLQIKEAMTRFDVIMAVGIGWNARGDVNMDTLLATADQRMYDAKREYYRKHPVE
jgi:diguanylate cyclase (GGDEF)-like protein